MGIISDRMGDSEPFYMPDPDLFGHADAYHLFTRYAAELDEAGFADRFPANAELRHIAIELLAERYAIDFLRADPTLIDEAIGEALHILEQRRQS
jgi:hypothetical protein